MKVIRYKKEDVEQYFDYESVIATIKKYGRVTYRIPRRKLINSEIGIEISNIEITAETILLDDCFEIKDFPFTSKECLQLKFGDMNHELSGKLRDYMREIKIIEFKTGRQM